MQPTVTVFLYSISLCLHFTVRSWPWRTMQKSNTISIELKTKKLYIVFVVTREHGKRIFFSSFSRYAKKALTKQKKWWQMFFFQTVNKKNSISEAKIVCFLPVRCQVRNFEGIENDPQVNTVWKIFSFGQIVLVFLNEEMWFDMVIKDCILQYFFSFFGIGLCTIMGNLLWLKPLPLKPLLDLLHYLAGQLGVAMSPTTICISALTKRLQRRCLPPPHTHTHSPPRI